MEGQVPVLVPGRVGAGGSQGDCGIVKEDEGMDTEKFQGTCDLAKPIKVAAVLSNKLVIINHGEREGMKANTPLAIMLGKEPAAILEVTKVCEKMSFASPVWVFKDSPVVGIGLELERLEL